MPTILEGKDQIKIKILNIESSEKKIKITDEHNMSQFLFQCFQMFQGLILNLYFYVIQHLKNKLIIW